MNSPIRVRVPQWEGRTLMSLLEATHGWSRQYLVEADVFRRAAIEAGFAVHGRAHLGAAAMGHDYLSVTRLALA